MFYRFPRSRVSIAATPKTGCTSVLTFLRSLESQLGSEMLPSQSSRGSVARRTPDENPSGGTALHADLRRNGLAIDATSPKAEGELRLAILRDPADRVASCWLDKVVDAPPAWQAKYHAQHWFPQDFRTPAAIEASFLAFLEALRGDPVLLHADPHWAPQAWMLRQWQQARYVTTEELTDFPTLVTSHLGQEVGMPPPPMPHMHRTEAWIKPFLLTHQAHALIGQVYATDIVLLEQCGKATPASRHATRAAIDAENALKLPTFDREVHMRRSRRLSRSLEKILDRAVWRHLINAQEQES